MSAHTILYEPSQIMNSMVFYCFPFLFQYLFPSCHVLALESLFIFIFLIKDIYIYIERERKRERVREIERERNSFYLHHLLI